MSRLIPMTLYPSPAILIAMAKPSPRETPVTTNRAHAVLRGAFHAGVETISSNMPIEAGWASVELVASWIAVWQIEYRAFEKQDIFLSPRISRAQHRCWQARTNLKELGDLLRLSEKHFAQRSTWEVPLPGRQSEPNASPLSTATLFFNRGYLFCLPARPARADYSPPAT